LSNQTLSFTQPYRKLLECTYRSEVPAQISVDHDAEPHMGRRTYCPNSNSRPYSRRLPISSGEPSVSCQPRARHPWHIAEYSLRAQMISAQKLSCSLGPLILCIQAPIGVFTVKCNPAYCLNIQLRNSISRLDCGQCTLHRDSGYSPAIPYVMQCHSMPTFM
jgi:hypothetical protein